MRRIVAVAVGFAATSALAYVPPSQFIVKKLADKRTGYKTVRVKTQVSGLSNDIPNGIGFKTLNVFDFATRTLRSRAIDEAGQELYVAERRLGAPNATLVDALTFDSSAADLANALKAAGIPIRTDEDILGLPTEEERRRAEISSIGRWKGTTAWVVGKKAQLWIEKDVFLPLKFVSDQYEIRFEGYRYSQEFAYPKAITLATGAPGSETAELRDEFVEMAINQDLAEMKSAVTIGFTDAGNSAPSEIRNLLIRYYQTIR